MSLESKYETSAINRPSLTNLAVVDETHPK